MASPASAPKRWAAAGCRDERLRIGPQPPRGDAQILEPGALPTSSLIKCSTRMRSIGEARVWGGLKWTVPAEDEIRSAVLFPVAAKDLRIKAQIIYKGPLKPPVKEDDRIGVVRITSDSAQAHRIRCRFMQHRALRRRCCVQGDHSILLGVNSYVSDAVMKLLKKPAPPQQPAAAAAPAISKS